jgi:hypothetical protein
MEETPFFIALRKQIPGENLKVYSSFFQTNTPKLQYSITPVDLYGQSQLSLTLLRGPGFLSLIKIGQKKSELL